jgi:hypothetical protein
MRRHCMNICSGCDERVSPGEEECSHCGTPLLRGEVASARPVLAGRKTFIAGLGQGDDSKAAERPVLSSPRETRLGGPAAQPQVDAGRDELYVPRGRAGRRLDPKDPFATAVQSEAVPSSSDDPSERRSKTQFWGAADPDSKPTFVGEAKPSTDAASDPWAEALAEPVVGRPKIVDAPDALVGVLVSYSLRSDGAVYPLRRGKTALGRSGDPGLDIALDDGKISSPHCMIIVRPSGVFLQDAVSTNGTWFRRGEDAEFQDIQVCLNNSARLEDGDFFRVGDSVFLVHLFDPGLVQRIWGS